MKIKCIIFLFTILFSYKVYSQIEAKGRPQALDFIKQTEIPVISIECSQRQKIFTIPDKQQNIFLKSSTDVEICKVNIDIQKEGLILKNSSKTNIYVLGIEAKNAGSISLNFTKFHLSDGVKMFVYNKEQTIVKGAYTSLNNKKYNKLSIAPVFSDMIIIELQVPSYLEFAGDLVLGEIFLGDKEKIKTGLKDGWYGLSASCNVDIQCSDNAFYHDMKYSVVRIVYAGSERCTGVLINSTNNAERPLLLTAQHCLSTEYLAETAIYTFDYESPICDGPDGSVEKSISGGNLLATTSGLLDFSLVELSEEPPLYFNPLYAGWDRRNNTFDSSFVIHHPQGDVKKISFDSDVSQHGDFSPYSTYNPNVHWLIENYDFGTTDNGSSGSPLFNKYGRVLGLLSGGGSPCTANIEDYYQKIYNCWEDYPDSTNQLKYWLDPINKGSAYVDGFDPYYLLKTFGDTLWNGNNDYLNNPENGSLDWGYISGHNSDSIRLYAEKFSSENKYFIVGVYLNIYKNYVADVNDTINLKIWSGENSPDQILFEKTVSAVGWEETNFNYVPLDTVINLPENFFVGYEINYYLPIDTFALWISEDRAASPMNYAFYFDNSWKPLNIIAENSYGYSLDIRPLVYDSIPGQIPSSIDFGDRHLIIAPVPAKDYIKIYFNEDPQTDVIVDIYDLNGKKVWNDIIINPSLETEYDKIRNLSTGIYIINIKFNNLVYRDKVVIIR